MRKKLSVGAVLAALIALAAVLAPAAISAPPERIKIDISESFTDPFLSTECGTPVVVRITGTATVTLWRNADGLIVRELDRAPGSKVIYSAPETGNSFSFPNSLVVTYDYGDGAAIGSETTVRARGVFGHVTGFIPSDAGTATFVGVVTGFDEFGIPLVDIPDPPIRETGNRETGEDVLAAFCEALSD
jgi:hypothetical protein